MKAGKQTEDAEESPIPDLGSRYCILLEGWGYEKQSNLAHIYCFMGNSLEPPFTILLLSLLLVQIHPTEELHFVLLNGRDEASRPCKCSIRT